MGEFKVNDNGVWKSNTPYVNDNGVWKQCSEVHVNDNNVWKKVYPSDIVASNTRVYYRGDNLNSYHGFCARKFKVMRSGSIRLKIMVYDCTSITIMRQFHTQLNYSLFSGTQVVDVPVTANEVLYIIIDGPLYGNYVYNSSFEICFDTTDGQTIGIIDRDACYCDYAGTVIAWY